MAVAGSFYNPDGSLVIQPKMEGTNLIPGPMPVFSPIMDPPAIAMAKDNLVTSPDLSTMNQKYEDQITSLQSKREDMGITTAEGGPRDIFDVDPNSKHLDTPGADGAERSTDN